MTTAHAPTASAATTSALLAGLAVVDLSQSRRVPILMEMVAGLSPASEPREVLRQFAEGFLKLWGPRGYVSLSTRGLGPGEYKITRLVTTNLADEFANADPWRDWARLPAHCGGIFGRIVRHGGPVALRNLDIRDDPVVGDVLARYRSLMSIPLFDAPASPRSTTGRPARQALGQTGVSHRPEAQNLARKEKETAPFAAGDRVLLGEGPITAGRNAAARWPALAMVLMHDDFDRTVSRQPAPHAAPRDGEDQSWIVGVCFGGPGASLPAAHCQPPEMADATVAVVHAAGDLTEQSVASLFFRCAQDAVRSAGQGSRLVFDLQGVERADSKLMAYLVELDRTARRVRAEIELRASCLVRHLIELYHLPFSVEPPASDSATTKRRMSA